MKKLMSWLRGKRSSVGSIRDSAYGRIPAEVGPSEGICVRLIPVDKSKRGAEITSGTVDRKRSRRIK